MSFSETAARLRKARKERQDTPSEFSEGDLVRTWPGNYPAIVIHVDPIEGDVTVLREVDGVVESPSFGWELTLLNEEGEPA